MNRLKSRRLPLFCSINRWHISVKKYPLWMLACFASRCRPEFAMQLLEQTKSLFLQDNIVVVYSTDRTQLAYSLQGVYGQNYDCRRYLQRFYDYRLDLPRINPNRHLSSSSMKSTALLVTSGRSADTSSSVFALSSCLFLNALRKSLPLIASRSFPAFSPVKDKAQSIAPAAISETFLS